MQRYPEGRPRRRAHDRLHEDRRTGQYDPLTGVMAHDWFHDRAAQQWERASRAHRPLSLMLIEVDGFDAYRERSGPAAADACLQQLGGLLAAQCRRRADFVGRLSDHVFWAMLSETTLDGGVKLGRQLREAVEALQLSRAPEAGVVTVSVGVASAWPRTSRFVESLVILAEDSLKEACERGGNCVVGAQDRGAPAETARRRTAQ